MNLEFKKLKKQVIQSWVKQEMMLCVRKMQFLLRHVELEAMQLAMVITPQEDARDLKSNNKATGSKHISLVNTLNAEKELLPVFALQVDQKIAMKETMPIKSSVIQA